MSLLVLASPMLLVFGKTTSTVAHWLSPFPRFQRFGKALSIWLPIISGLLLAVARPVDIVSGSGRWWQTALLYFAAALNALFLAIRMIQFKEEEIDAAGRDDLQARLRKGLKREAGASADREFLASLLTVASAQVLHDPTSTPATRMVWLLEATYTLLRKQLEMKADDSLRIVYYQERDGFFEPVFAWDGTSTECVKTPLGAHREHFNAQTGGSLVAQVARKRKQEIISDADRSDFNFYDNEQKRTIRSIIGLPLRVGDSHTPVRHVCTIDSGVPKLFLKKHGLWLKWLGLVLQSFLLYPEGDNGQVELDSMEESQNAKSTA